MSKYRYSVRALLTAGPFLVAVGAILYLVTGNYKYLLVALLGVALGFILNVAKDWLLERLGSDGARPMMILAMASPAIGACIMWIVGGALLAGVGFAGGLGIIGSFGLLFPQIRQGYSKLWFLFAVSSGLGLLLALGLWWGR